MWLNSGGEVLQPSRAPSYVSSPLAVVLGLPPSACAVASCARLQISRPRSSQILRQQAVSFPALQQRRPRSPRYFHQRASSFSQGACLYSGTMNGYDGGAGGAAAWQEHRTPDGRAYYYNAATKVTQWTKPEELMSGAEVRYGRR